jgi:hypothetical protein
MVLKLRHLCDGMSDGGRHHDSAADDDFPRFAPIEGYRQRERNAVGGFQVLKSADPGRVSVLNIKDPLVDNRQSVLAFVGQCHCPAKADLPRFEAAVIFGPAVTNRSNHYAQRFLLCPITLPGQIGGCPGDEQRKRVGPWLGGQRRGNGSSPHWNVKAGPALSGPFALGEKLGVADLGRPDFEILGGLVIILRQQSKRHFQIVLPRQIGQLPEMVCSVTTVGNVDHPRETARPVNRSHSAACAAGSDPD